MAKRKKDKFKLDDETLLQHGALSFQNSRNWRGEKIDPQWEEENDLYNGNFSPNEIKNSEILGKGRLFIPKTYSHVQRVLAEIMETIFFDNEEIVSIEAWKNIPGWQKDTIQTLLNYRLNGNPINFYQEALEFVLDGLKNKLGIFKVWPELSVKESKATNYWPEMSCIPYEDVFFDKNATWKDYYKYTIIHRMKKKIDYLKRKGYKNLDDIGDYSVNEASTDRIKQQRSNEQSSPFTQDTMVDADKSVYVYEIWTFLDVNNTGFLNSAKYLCAGDGNELKMIISDVEENKLPYKRPGDIYNRPPFVVGTPYPEAHVMYAKSLPGITKSLQRETNSIRNQAREANAMAIRAPMLVKSNTGINLMDVVNRKMNAVITGNDISENAIRQLSIQGNTQSNIAEAARTDQDFFETTSVPPGLLGAASPTAETATATVSQVTNATKKISYAIKNLVITGMIPAFNMLLRLEQTYETDKFIIELIGNKIGSHIFLAAFANKMKPSDIIKRDVGVQADVGINKQVQINRLQAIMEKAILSNQVMAQLLQTRVVKPENSKFINIFKLFTKQMKLLGEKNIDEYLINGESPPDERNQVPGIASQPANNAAPGTGVNLLGGGSGAI